MQQKKQQLHLETGKSPKNKIGTIKADSPRAHPHEIPEVEKHQKLHHSGDNYRTQL